MWPSSMTAGTGTHSDYARAARRPPDPGPARRLLTIDIDHYSTVSPDVLEHTLDAF